MVLGAAGSSCIAAVFVCGLCGFLDVAAFDGACLLKLGFALLVGDGLSSPHRVAVV